MEERTLARLPVSSLTIQRLIREAKTDINRIAGLDFYLVVEYCSNYFDFDLYILYFNDTLTLKNTNTNYVTSNSIMLIVKISNFVRRTRTKLKLGDNQLEKILTRAIRYIL